MAIIDPEIPSEFPDGYVPFYLRVNVGEWWNFDNTSNFWCCNEDGISMEMWFYLDMYFMMYIFWEYAQSFSCPIDAETNFWIWEDCEEYEHTAFQFNLTSTVTDDGTGESVMTGGQYKEMILKIAANSETSIPYLWMKSGYGMCLTTDNDSVSEIRFFSADTTMGVGSGGDGYYFGFGVSTPTPGIMDSVISSTPISEPTAYDRNIFLKPSEYGKVKFGEYSTDGAKTITGYIEIVTADGKIRKLAVIDDEDEYQEQHQAV
jgi:hypothetical protein